MQAARKCIDDGQEKLAAAAAERSAASAAKDKELWARDAELRRLQVKVEAAEAAAAARRAEAERMKELVDVREQEAQAAERSRVEASLSFDALTQTALQKQLHSKLNYVAASDTPEQIKAKQEDVNKYFVCLHIVLETLHYTLGTGCLQGCKS